MTWHELPGGKRPGVGSFKVFVASLAYFCTRCKAELWVPVC